MAANQEKLDSISNNLANIGTTGYKKVKVEFKDLMSETLNRTGYPINSEDAFTGTGVRATGYLRDLTQGSVMETGFKTDLAIDGTGYFRVSKSDGSFAYTRDGSFSIDSRGRLVDAKGNILSINFKEGYSYDNVSLSQENFTVNNDGGIQVIIGGNFQEVGSIPLYTAIGDDAFLPSGDSLYLPKDGVIVREGGDADLLQGFLEGSNVNMAEEFTDMIITQRAFELGSRSIKTADEMWGMINNLRSR